MLNEDESNIFKVNLQFQEEKLKSYGIDINSNTDQDPNLDEFTKKTKGKFLKKNNNDPDVPPLFE